MEILEGYLWSFTGPYKEEAIITPHEYLYVDSEETFILTSKPGELTVKYFDDGPINPTLCTKFIGFLYPFWAENADNRIGYEVTANSDGWVRIIVHR